MSTLSQFAGGGPNSQPPIANGIPPGTDLVYATGFSPHGYTTGHQSGSTTSTTYVDLVNYSGSGVLMYAAIYGGDAASLSVLVDGVEISVATLVADANIHYKTAVGVMSFIPGTSAPASFIPVYIPFRTSLQIRHKSGAGILATSYFYYYKTR